MSRITSRLPESLMATLVKGGPALLLTVGEDGYPGTAFTWVLAVDSMEV